MTWNIYNVVKGRNNGVTNPAICDVGLSLWIAHSCQNWNSFFNPNTRVIAYVNIYFKIVIIKTALLNLDKFDNKQIDSILDEVYTFGVGIKWFGLSWRNDLGLRLKQNYPNNFIPIYLNDKEYVSLEDTIVDEHSEFNTWHYKDKNNLRLSDTIDGVKDTHLSSIGHEVVAKSILRKIKWLTSIKKMGI